MPGREGEPSPPDGYDVFFVYFHVRGFATPAHRFFRGLWHYYQIELQHLNPNGIRHITVFIALCEGYLGIEPHFELWKYFFAVSLITKDVSIVLMGYAGIHLHSRWAIDYLEVTIMRSNKGWHSLRFYVRNDVDNRLPIFPGRIIEGQQV